MNSLALLLAGEADVMAMDCVLHALLSWHRPTALSETRVLEGARSCSADLYVSDQCPPSDREFA